MKKYRTTGQLISALDHIGATINQEPNPETREELKRIIRFFYEALEEGGVDATDASADWFKQYEEVIK